MTKQQIKLTIMFILGLPGLPLACIFWLMLKYIFQSESITNGQLTPTEEFIALMFAMTMYVGMIMLLVRWAT
jgi:hypothetical protein